MGLVDDSGVLLEPCGIRDAKKRLLVVVESETPTSHTGTAEAVQ